MQMRTDAFKGKRIAIVGDLMLDRFLWGENTRLSPEAPVPVVCISKETTVPGGAGNVAANIASLGGTPILFGVVGDDAGAQELLTILSDRGVSTDGILSDTDRPTTEKTRIIGNEKQVVRVDRESTEPLSDTMLRKFLDSFKRLAADADAVVFSDYAKGVFSVALLSALVRQVTKGDIPLVGDMKPMHIKHTHGITLLTSNVKEVCEATSIGDFAAAGRRLAKELGSSVLVTRGRDGMSLFKDGSVEHFPTHARSVSDVAGAGDTVTATVALALAAGMGKREAAELANRAAGIVVGKAGVATVSYDEIMNA